jgi:hypothetical protein
MLSLKQGLSLVSTPIIAWSPSQESSLEAWYQKGEGITLNGSDVSSWADSSSNSYDMVQGTASEQPAYSAGVLTFASADKNNLQTSGADIELTGDFTVGAKIHLTAGGGTLLGDNTVTGEFIRFSSTSEFRVRVAGATAVNIDKDSGTWLEDAYMVLTRVSGVFTLYWKGVAQADTETKAGTAKIDAIGVRNLDNNPYEGTISEIQIYSSSSAALTSNINDRLSTL